MVHIRHIALIIFLMWLAVFSAGCAISPGKSPPSAPVEEHGRSVTPPGQAGRITEEPVAKEPEPIIEAAPLSPSPPDKSGTQVFPGENQETEKSGAAVVALLDTADRETEAGRQGQAIASLERALRIEPKNPLLWNRLARLHLQNSQWSQAIAMAKKSNVLAVKDRKLQSDNWGIIARAREAIGDKVGARQAMDMAQQLLN